MAHGFGSQESETGIGVKKANIIERIPRDERDKRIKDIIHAQQDITWWAENFFKIITLDKGLTTIKLYPKQREFLQFIVGNSRIMGLASRQTGKCIFKETPVFLKNKKTGEIQCITIENFAKTCEH